MVNNSAESIGRNVFREGPTCRSMSQLTRSFKLCSDAVELLACIHSSSARCKDRDVEAAWKRWRALSGQAAAGAYNEALFQSVGTDVVLSSASVLREDKLMTASKIEQPCLNLPTVILP